VLFKSEIGSNRAIHRNDSNWRISISVALAIAIVEAFFLQVVDPFVSLKVARMQEYLEIDVSKPESSVAF
jgi:hypothetical protein